MPVVIRSAYGSSAAASNQVVAVSFSGRAISASYLDAYHTTSSPSSDEAPAQGRRTFSNAGWDGGVGAGLRPAPTPHPSSDCQVTMNLVFAGEKSVIELLSAQPSRRLLWDRSCAITTRVACMTP